MAEIRVKIDAGGRVVEVSAPAENVSPGDIIDRTLTTWHETAGAPPAGAGPAFGLATERRGDGPDPTNTGIERRYPTGPVRA